MRYILRFRFWVSAALIIATGIASPASGEPFRYSDAQGRVRYVDSLDKVPAEYRASATSGLPGISKVPGSKISLEARPAIEIYVAEWCPLCVALEKYLRKHDVAYTRYDIERSIEGKQRYLALGGGGVPIIKIGNQIIRGYREADVAAALKIN